MTITFEFLAQARAAAGADSISLALDGTTSLERALGKLAQERGETLGRLLLTAEGKVQPSLIVLINGEPAAREGRSLTEGDVVILLTPIGGG